MITDSDYNKRVYLNLVKQPLRVNRPNCVLVSDNTYIRKEKGWPYLAGVKNLYTKKRGGYAIDKFIKADLVYKALNKAIKENDLAKGLLFIQIVMIIAKS